MLDETFDSKAEHQATVESKPKEGIQTGTEQEDSLEPQAKRRKKYHFQFLG